MDDESAGLPLGELRRPRVLLLCLGAALLLVGLGVAGRHGLTVATRKARVGSSSAPDAAKQARIVNLYSRLPLAFEANRGQYDPRVRFSAMTPGYRISFTRQDAKLEFPGSDPRHPSVVGMEFIGQASTSRVVGTDRLPGTSNYFIGRNPRSWRTNVPNYAKVKYEGIYPGIDLVFYGRGPRLEYDFDLRPGADPARVKILVSGLSASHGAQLEPDGALLLSTERGNVQMLRPVMYQDDAAGHRHAVQCHYTIQKLETVPSSDIEVGFEAGNYDQTRSAVIDPALTFATNLGGSGLDSGGAIAVDAAGNIYVTGIARSQDFPTVAPYQRAPKTMLADGAFVTKINAAGSAILYSTYLGGSDDQSGEGIAVDSSGSAYVAGTTNSSDFPTTSGSFQTSCQIVVNGGCFTAFVTKFDTSGSRLEYSTYLGGTSTLGVGGATIAVDTRGSAYVTGGTFAADFPTTPGAFSTTGSNNVEQVFVAKLDPSGSTLSYGTYLGLGEAFGIAVNSAGEAYIAGAAAPGYPVTPGAFQTAFGDIQVSYEGNGFVTHLSRDGSALIYSTYLGGNNRDTAGAIAIDAAGDAYVTGGTESVDFPVLNAFQQNLRGTGNAYVAKLNPTGTALVYSTYLGGSAYDAGNGIAVDSSGNAYVIGSAQSPDFPTVAPLQPIFGGGLEDVFLATFDPSGRLQFSTFLGGNSVDSSNGIAADGAGNVYLTGSTSSANFPIANALQPNLVGLQNAFVAKLSISTPTPSPDFVISSSLSTASIAAGQTAVYYIQIAPVGGFDLPVSITCSGLPPLGTCRSFPVNSNGLNTVVESVYVGTTYAGITAPMATQGQPITPRGKAGHSVNLGPICALAFILLLFGGICVSPNVGSLRTQSLMVRCSLAIVLFSVSLALGCGGGGGGGGVGGDGSTGGTPSGAYTITLTAASGNLTHSVTVTLNVR